MVVAVIQNLGGLCRSAKTYGPKTDTDHLALVLQCGDGQANHGDGRTGLVGYLLGGYRFSGKQALNSCLHGRR